MSQGYVESKLRFRLAENEAAPDKILGAFCWEQARREELLAKSRPIFLHLPTTNGEQGTIVVVSSDLECVPIHRGSLLRVACLPSMVLTGCAFPRITVDTILVMRSRWRNHRCQDRHLARGSSAPDGSVKPDDSDPKTIVIAACLDGHCGESLQTFAGGESWFHIFTAIANADHFGHPGFSPTSHEHLYH